VDEEFLDDVRLVAPECGVNGKALGMQRHLTINPQLRRLGPLGRTRPLAALRPFDLGLGGFQTAGLDIGTRLQSLEAGDLVASLRDRLLQLRNAVFLDPKQGEQTLDERAAFYGWDIGKRLLHTVEL
jgi:hypothetical protein